MGLYVKYVLARLIDAAMRNKETSSDSRATYWQRLGCIKPNGAANQGAGQVAVQHENRSSTILQLSIAALQDIITTYATSMFSIRRSGCLLASRRSLRRSGCWLASTRSL
jgi:hypothetical protein